MYPIKDVTNTDRAFGSAADAELMPSMEAIPREFHMTSGNAWVALMEDWFFVGLKSLKTEPKDGVDTDKAMRHISTVMRSFSSAHEHKTAAVAFLLSEWFTYAEWERKDGFEGTRTAGVDPA